MENDNQEKLVRLIYLSILTEECDSQELDNILKVSRANNAKKQITGFLCYDPAFFIQCIEGPREVVNGLFTAISRDNRHINLTLLEYNDISERLFEDWAMGFIPFSNIDTDILDKYAVNTGRFNPFTLSGNQARELLQDIVKHHRSRISQ